MRTPSGSDPFDFIDDLTMFAGVCRHRFACRCGRADEWSKVGLSENVTRLGAGSRVARLAQAADYAMDSALADW